MALSHCLLAPDPLSQPQKSTHSLVLTFEVTCLSMLTSQNKLQKQYIKSCTLHIHMPSLVAQSIKESDCSARDPGLIPGLGRSPGGGNGNPLQYSCLGKPTDRSAWRATVGHDLATKPPPTITYMHINVYTCFCEYMIVIYTFMSIHKHMYIYVYIQTYIHTCVCVYSHTHTQTHTHVIFQGPDADRE